MIDSMDYEALGFRLTLTDVAEVLEITRAEVLDHVRASELPVLWLPVLSGAYPRAEARFHPNAVGALAARLKQGSQTADARNRVRAQDLLRRYLAATPPTDDYDEALSRNLPLLASTRLRRAALHVRAEALAEFQASEGVAAPMLRSSLAHALEGIGAVRMRGVVPASERGGKQRWGTWWRVPESVMGADEQAAMVDAVCGVRDGEEVTRSGSGSWHLKKTLGVD